MDENEAGGTKLFSKRGRDTNAREVAEASQEMPHTCGCTGLTVREHRTRGKTLTLSGS